MALLRMTAIALVACRTAGADPGEPAQSHGPGAPPPGWKQLPRIATAAGAAARADGVTVDAVDAWGDPALGCYAVWLALRGGVMTAPALADQVLDSLRQAGGPRQELSLGEIARPSGPSGGLALSFTRPPYRGRVRAQLGPGRIAALACFGDQREPAACDAACARLLERAPEGAR